jgi:hypothetical protein
VPHPGKPKPIHLVPVPNPQNGGSGGLVLHFSTLLEADADSLELKVYGKSMAIVGHCDTAGYFPAGWAQADFRLSQPLSNGLYYAVIIGHSSAGGSAQCGEVAKLYILR